MDPKKTISDKIKHKLEVTIPIMIFLIVVIKEFLSISGTDNASKTFIAFSLLIGIYIIIYGLYYIFEKNLVRNRYTIMIDYLLTVNFFLVGLQIIHVLFSVAKDSLTSFFIITLYNILSYTLAFIFLIPIIIFLIFVVFIPFEHKK
jgi:hypothetical protein